MRKSFGGKIQTFIGSHKGKRTLDFSCLGYGRRKKLSINRIKDKNSQWVEGVEQVVGATLSFY